MHDPNDLSDIPAPFDEEKKEEKIDVYTSPFEKTDLTEKRYSNKVPQWKLIEEKFEKPSEKAIEPKQKKKKKKNPSAFWVLKQLKLGKQGNFGDLGEFIFKDAEVLEVYEDNKEKLFCTVCGVTLNTKRSTWIAHVSLKSHKKRLNEPKQKKIGISLDSEVEVLMKRKRLEDEKVSHRVRVGRVILSSNMSFNQLESNDDLRALFEEKRDRFIPLGSNLCQQVQAPLIHSVTIDYRNLFKDKEVC